MLRRLAVIVNPHAGGGRAGRLLPAVRARLAADGHDAVVTATRSLDHADELVVAALADGRDVVAMGGDGLVGRVAGCVAAGDGLLAVLPGGRGNDFARATGLERSPVRACRHLLDGVERRVDLGEAGGVAFLGIASVGFDSDVQERALTTVLPLGPAVYAWAALLAVRAWRPARFSAVLDGTPTEVRGWAVAVANSGVYGGGMRLAPQASLSDGLLDVVSTSTSSRTHFLRSLPSVFRGTHLRDPTVQVQQARTVLIDADRPFRVFADGDPVATLPCTVTVRPAALRVLLPR